MPFFGTSRSGQPRLPERCPVEDPATGPVCHRHFIEVVRDPGAPGWVRLIMSYRNVRKDISFHTRSLSLKAQVKLIDAAWRELEDAGDGLIPLDLADD